MTTCDEGSRVSLFHRKAYLWAPMLVKITVTEVLQKSKILSLEHVCVLWAILLLVEVHLPTRSGSELWLKTKPLPKSAEGWRACWASGHETTEENVSTFFTPICLKCWNIINSESYQKAPYLGAYGLSAWSCRHVGHFSKADSAVNVEETAGKLIRNQLVH